MDTMRIATFDQAWVERFDRSAIDGYLAAGDLAGERCLIVDPTTGRGQPVDPYRQPPQTSTRPTALDPFVATDYLLDQRTIVLNDAQGRLGDHVQDLCNDVSTAFRSLVQVNCYLSHGDARGFGEHWDDHDVIVIPISGRKYWEVFQATELGPLTEFSPTGSTAPSIWSGVMAPGTALYIPRGWPHRVAGLAGETSIHLTLSNRRMNGIDVLRLSPIDSIVDASALDGVALDAAVAQWQAEITTTPIGGPVGLLEARATAFEHHEFRLAMPGGCVFAMEGTDAEQLRLAANARCFDLRRGLTPALESALTQGWWSVSTLTESAGLPVSDVTEFIDALGIAGCLHLRALPA